MVEEGRKDQEDQAYENITGEPWHKCKQEKRITRLEEKQDETIKSIDDKLSKIWTAINQGDKDNLKTIITVSICFIGAVVTVFVAFIAFLKFA